jgi:hypothetical protein
VTSPPSSHSKEIGRTFQGAQLGTQEFQSKSYTERKHIEELEFKKTLLKQDGVLPSSSKPKEPSIKEREQEIVAMAGSQMFDLSLLTERPDEDELEEKRRHYEHALSSVGIIMSITKKTHALSAEDSDNVIMASLSSLLSNALTSMRVTAMRDARLVDEFSPLP